MKKVREEYILELFKFKNKFARRTESSGDEKDQAYKDLISIIKKYIEKMVRMEKNKYMRERIYYRSSNQVALFQQADKMYQNCRNEVTDNLVKQAKTICKPTKAEFERYFEEFNVED